MYITKDTIMRLAKYAASSVEHVKIEVEVCAKNYFYIAFYMNDYTIGVDINVYLRESIVYAYVETYEDIRPEDIYKCKNFKELKEFFKEIKNIIES